MKKVKFVALLILLIIIGTLFVGCKKEEAPCSIILLSKSAEEDGYLYWFEFKTNEPIEIRNYAFIVKCSEYKGETFYTQFGFCRLYGSKVITEDFIINTESVSLLSGASIYFKCYVALEQINENNIKILIQKTDVKDGQYETAGEYYLN